MLTGSTSLSYPSTHEVFAQLFSESRTGYYNVTVLHPMIKWRPHLLYLFKLVSLIIDLHFRITQVAREVKNGPSKREKTFSVQFLFIKKVFGRQRTHYRKEALTWNVHSQCILMGHSSAPSVNNKIKRGRLFQSFPFKGSGRAGL